MEENIIQKKITIHDFFFEFPLYEKFNRDKIDGDIYLGDVDAWSSKNKTDTTYSISNKKIFSKEIWKGGGNYEYLNYYLVSLSCRRKNNDVLRFFIYEFIEVDSNKTIIKVGQDPSIADLQFSDIDRKYKNILDKEYLKEFKKSIVSVTHGFGVAAFVYLRRIFENLILKEFVLNGNEIDIDHNDFIKKRMSEKIEILKEYLPSQLIQMKAVYGILSKGIHELSEEECLDYYGTLKLSVELILDQKIENEIKRKRDSEVKKKIMELTNKVSK